MKINNIGKRLHWCRSKLGISQTEVSIETGIPLATYSDREAGAMARYPEEYLLLSQFYSTKWALRFNESNFPTFEGEKIKTISTNWIIFGVDVIEKKMQSIIDEFKTTISEIERDHIYKEMELKRQLSLFSLS